MSPFLRLELSALQLVMEWRRVGQTSDYVAQMVGPHLSDPVRGVQVVSTVTNELLENAAKFAAPADSLVSLTVRCWGDHVELEVGNVAERDQVERFCRILHELHTGDLDALYAARIQGAHEQGAAAPGIGLLVLARDYQADLQAHFEPTQLGRPDAHCVVVTAGLALDGAPRE